MRTIALEERYATTKFLNGPGSWHKSCPELAEALADLGDGRIEAMDDGGIDLAVLSLAAPGVEQLDGPHGVHLARECNDELAAVVHKYPDRPAGFATLPVSEPDAAAELERAVRSYGFVGAVVNGHCRGVYLDDPHFEPVVERAAALRAPMGEAIPFMVPRFDARLKPELTGLNHPISSYLRTNLHYTFANFKDGPTYANLVAQVGADRVAFSTDHPFGSMRAARVFLDNLPLSEQDRARISHRNAEELLGL